jgi:hypothetical protein
VQRLLGEAARHGNDAELFAGLVHACRYCGLNEQSVAAHVEARRLDPNVPTSVEQTLLMMGEVDRMLAMTPSPMVAGADDAIRAIALGLSGRRDEARLRLQQMRQASRIPLFAGWLDYLDAWLAGRPQSMRVELADMGLKIEDDPEAIFQQAWLYCDVGEHERGLADLRRAVDSGYYVAATLAERPQFAALRGDARFEAILADAVAGRDRALEVFRRAGGERLIGAVAAA